MKTVYISGPVTGLAEEEYKANFEKAKEELKAAGYAPVNPIEIEHPPGTLEWREYMKGDLKVLLNCDAIYMMEGWRGSDGARTERDVAYHLELDIMYQHRLAGK